MKRKLDLSVYLIADPAVCAGRAVEDIVPEALKGGVRMVQYRDKSDSASDIQEGAARVKEIIDRFCQGTGQVVTYVVNDHVHIAKEIGADGVHLGQGDGDPQKARAILGADAIIGWTAFTAEHMNAIDPSVIDYVGTGPFYPTPLKKDKAVLGTEGFAPLAKMSKVPVVGIGGITVENAAPVIAAGADGVAMMRSISAADDPEAAARRLCEIVRQARQERQAA